MEISFRFCQNAPFQNFTENISGGMPHHTPVGSRVSGVLQGITSSQHRQPLLYYFFLGKALYCGILTKHFNDSSKNFFYCMNYFSKVATQIYFVIIKGYPFACE